MVGDPNSGNQPVNFGQLVRFTVFSATQVVPANAGDIRSLGGEDPPEGAWQLTPVLVPREFH